MKEIEDHTNRKIYRAHVLEDLSVKITTLPKEIYRLSTIPIKITMALFTD